MNRIHIGQLLLIVGTGVAAFTFPTAPPPAARPASTPAALSQHTASTPRLQSPARYLDRDRDGALRSERVDQTTAQVHSVPRQVRAIYLTSWSAGTPSRISQTIDLIKTTELNGIVIDLKDYTGKVVFPTSNPLITKIGSQERRIGDLTQLVERLHREGIYVIARFAVFQDQHLIAVRPDLAVRDSAGRIWRDRKGLGWVDPASRDVWSYVVEIAREAARAGVDELNFDYVRFPSDGNLSQLQYPIYHEQAESRRDVIRRFFEFLSTELRPTGKVLSVDLFGLATVKNDDLGIGQVIEDAFLYFDFISPMVYPSHYARGFLQFTNPAAHPYEVVRYSLERAAVRRAEFAHLLASFTVGSNGDAEPSPVGKLARFRPWLQAFDLGAPYPPAVIRRQIAAVYNVGLDSGWYLWSPSNRYELATFEHD